MKRIIEVCAGSYQDCLAAYRGGAQRAELNSALSVGGLTPSVAALRRAKQETSLKIICMVRPRAAGFCYDEADVQIMMDDARILLQEGADGIAFGFLDEHGRVAAEDTAAMCELIHSFGKEAVFHRAIDVAQDWRDMLSRLIDLGVDRVLTSGQAPDVSYGTDTVREMIQFAAGRIQILPGAGINAKNIRRVLEQTGATQLHLARHTARTDKSTLNNRDIFYGGCLYPSETTYDVTDGDYIAGLRDQLL